MERAAAAGAGGLVRSDPTTPFPIGTGANPLAPDLGQLDYSRLVTTPLAMVLGTKEDPAHQSNMQASMEEVRRFAREKGITCRVEFLPVPGAGHSSVAYWPVAREFLFPANAKAHERK